MTITQYKQWLQKSKLLNDLKAFEKLPKDKQQKILNYLFNPDVLKKMLATMENMGTKSSEKLYNGDIELTNTKVDDIAVSKVMSPNIVSMASTPSTRRKATFYANSRILGYDTVRIYNYVNYYTNKGLCTSASSEGGSVVRNIDPILSIQKGEHDHWLSKYKYYAYGEIYWDWVLGIEGYGYPLGTIQVVTRGDRYGHSYGWTHRIN
jgi:hypothetical protein